MSHKVIGFCFDGGKKNFILLNYFGAPWVRKKINGQVFLSKQEIKDAVNDIFTYCYFTVG